MTDIHKENKPQIEETENAYPEGSQKYKLTHDQFELARLQATSETKSVWLVIKENPKAIASCAAVQTMAIVMGTEYTFLGALVGVQAFCKTMGVYDAATSEYAVEAWALSLWAAVFGVMQFAGQAFAGWFSDRFGRLKGLYLTIFFTYAGTVTEAVAGDRNAWTGAKIIMGVATGMMQVIVPSYVAEIAPREIRGILIGLFSFNMSLGSLIGTLVAYGGNQAFGGLPLNDMAFRLPLYVGLAIPTVTLALLPFCNRESPYWLVLKERTEDAKKAIKWLHPERNDEELQDDVDLLVYTVAKEQEESARNKDASFLDCFRGNDLRRTFVAAFPSLSQQLCGNQLVASYSTYFFTVANFSNSLAASCIVSAVGLIGGIIAFFVVEMKAIGRWTLLFVGIIMVTICMFGIGITDSAAHDSYGSASGNLLIFFVALFNFAVAIGPGVAGWAYAGETGSARLRAKTTSLATGSNAIVGTIMNIVIPYELTAIGPLTGYMFGGIAVVCVFITYFFIPDLTGRSFSEIDELFERHIPARKFKGTACTGDFGRGEEDVIDHKH